VPDVVLTVELELVSKLPVPAGVVRFFVLVLALAIVHVHLLDIDRPGRCNTAADPPVIKDDLLSGNTLKCQVKVLFPVPGIDDTADIIGFSGCFIQAQVLIVPDLGLDKRTFWPEEGFHAMLIEVHILDILHPENVHLRRLNIQTFYDREWQPTTPYDGKTP
jgi:hypothetical protein